MLVVQASSRKPNGAERRSAIRDPFRNILWATAWIPALRSQARLAGMTKDVKVQHMPP